MNLTRKTWPAGWYPSQDARNGSPNALIKMQNLELDEEGIVGLVNGCEKFNQSTFDSYVHSIYSKYLGSIKYRFVGLASGHVKCLDANANEVFDITGTLHSKTGFNSVFGQILIGAGLVRKKWNGTTLNDLGLAKPGTISAITEINQPIIDLRNLNGDQYTNWILGLGDNFTNTDLVSVDTNSNSFAAVNTPIVNNPFNFGGDPGTEEDTFSIEVRIENTNNLELVRVAFWMAPDPDVDLVDCYQFEWKNGDMSPFNLGEDVWTTLTCQRKDFVRAGYLTNPAKSWPDTGAIEVVVRAAAGTQIQIKNPKFIGGEQGKINGLYDYAVIHVNNTGVYQAKSPLSDARKNIEIINGAAKIAITDPTLENSQANEAWIFRRNALPNDVIPIGENQGLDKWYRIKQIILATDPLEFYDTMSDEDAIKENVIANEYLISVQDINEDIIGIETNYYTRTLYLTPKAVYLSEQNNPDLVDPRYTIILAGNPTELNLWLVKVSLGTLVVATTYDFHEISGTLLDLPDGSLDAQVKGFSSKFPSLGYDVAVDAGFIFYVTSDGIRSISSSGSGELISGTLNLLFQDETRHGISPFFTVPRGIVSYPLTIAQGKLWISIASKDYTRRLYVYNFKDQYWHNRYLFVTALFAEEDGILLGGFGEGEGQNEAFIRVLNTGNTIDVTTWPTQYQGFDFQTIFDDNGQPRNRKDVFTLKLTADTGNYPVTIYIGKDSESLINLGNYTFNGFDEQLIRLEGVIEPGMAYAIRITSNSVPVFKLYNFTIEYEPFPEQLNFLRIPNTNLGSYSRKRITNYAFVVDTLGNSITFTPIVDGVALTTSSVIFTGKRTFIHYFTSETIGTDIGGTLHGGTFEFYSVALDEIISEKLPVPVKYLVIPANDYGNPNRKRHSSYKFQINTRGYNVRFTPKLDGVLKTSITINTSEKRTVEYFFSEDTIAIDIGGILETLVDEEFEFYGVIVPQQIEVLPPRLKEFRIPENNLGIASRKRIRTLPLEINTNGYDVTFTPIVDGVSADSTTLNTTTRKTAFYYFDEDSFGIDYSGELIGTEPFEFYGLLKPEGVEVLPVAKKLDQIGPLRFDKIAKLLACRVRLISTGDSTIDFKFHDEDYDDLSINEIYSKLLAVTAQKDEIYEFAFPKTVKGSTIRITIGPTIHPFHRYDLQLKVVFAGMDADPKWIKVK